MCNYRKFAIAGMIVVLSVISYSLVFAGCTTTKCTGYIERLYFNDAGELLIATDGNEAVLNCDSPADVYVTIPPSDANFNRKYSMILLALSNKKPIALRINEGSDRCSVNYVYIDQ